MIEVDADVRRLFEEEAAIRLARLNDHAVSFETAEDREALLHAMFREAHTLKGAAAVVGLDRFRDEAHDLEELLHRLRSGVDPVTPEAVDAVLAGVDRLAGLAVAGTVPPADAVAAAGPGTPAGPVHRQDHETARVATERLDELVRLAGESAATHLRLIRHVRDRLGPAAEAIAEIRDLQRLLNELQEKTLRARMVPVTAVSGVLRRAVRDVGRATGKSVRCEVRGEDTELDRGVLERLSGALLHVVRNAVDHGIEDPVVRRASGKPDEGVIVVHAMQLGSRVIVTVSDDGRGVDTDRVRQEARRAGIDTSAMGEDDVLQLVFRSGLSTADSVSDVSGRGVGLDVVRDVLDGLRGHVEIRSSPGEGTQVRISVPITLAVLRCLVVEAGGNRYALPLHAVRTVRDLSPGDELVVDGRPSLLVGEQAVAVSSLAAALESGGAAAGPVVVVSGLSRTCAFRVDRLVDQRDVVVKSLGRLVPPLEVVTGGSVEPDGSVMVVLDAHGLVERVHRAAPSGPGVRASSPGPARARGRVLVVDDALTVRELQRSILERAGYQVHTAADGVEALAVLAERSSDLVLTDVEMPRMDGLALTAAIRDRAHLAGLPVVILTSRGTDEDRRRGMEAGADAYVVKSAFDEAALLGVVERLLGEAAA